MQPTSLYLHIPFCQHRCAYCDFNTYAGLEDLIPAYVAALQAEIRFLADPKRPIHTVFFGGGTPSLLSARQVSAILDTLRASFKLLPDAEITLEANPGTTSLAALKDLRAAGANRLSFGVQSAHPEELIVLERTHSYPEAIQAVQDARLAGFDNLNLDLMFALPGQSLEAWSHTLDLALQLRPQHYSLYSLTFEHGTPFAALHQRGLFAVPDQDLAAEMYRLAQEKLAAAGYAHYEISNWALASPDGPDLRCQHNLQYWRNQPYLGLGAGAHGWLGGFRTRNVLAPEAYIQRLSSPPAEASAFPRTPATLECSPIDRAGQMAETMMMGLRLLEEGIPAEEFQQRYSVALEDQYGSQIEALIAKGLLAWTLNGTRRLTLTERGRFLGNQVFLEFI